MHALGPTERRRRLKRPLPRHVNGMTVKGRRYYYFRRGPGAKPIRLPDFGTPEFEIAYQKALHAEGAELVRARTLPGTLNEAVVSYYKSPAFRELAQSSRLDASLVSGKVSREVRR